MTRRPALVAALGLALVAALWALRVAVLARYPAVVSPDCGIRLAMVQSYLSGGSLVRVDRPAELHPLRFGLAELPSGTWYFYPPLFPLLSAFPYRVAGLPGLLVLPFVAGLLACGLTAAAGRRLGLGSWPALGPATGLATALFFYSVVFWDPALVIACAALAAFGMARGDVPGGALAGAALGAGAFLHEMLIVLGAAVVLAGLLSRSTRRPSVAALATLGAGLAAWAATNLALFGRLEGAHMSGGNVTGVARVLGGAEPGHLWPRVVEQVGGVPSDAPAHVLALAFAVGLFLFARWNPASRLLVPSALVGGVVLSLAADRTNGVVHGLFTASPLLLLALLAPLAAKPGARKEDVVAAWMARSSLLFGVAVLLLPFGPGFGWGSRYLLTSLPLLVLLAARDAEKVLRPAESGARPVLARAALAAALAASVVLQFRGTHRVREALRGWTVLFSEAERSPAEIVVTDELSVGPCLAPLGLSKAILYVDRPGLERAVLERLERGGTRSIGWIGSDAGLARLEAELAAARPPFERAAAKDAGRVRALVRSPGRP